MRTPAADAGESGKAVGTGQAPATEGTKPARSARNPGYTPFHPRWHRRGIPIFWWLRKFNYVRFITRELTSFAVGYAALLLVAQGFFLARGPEAYETFRRWLLRPWALWFHSLVLLALLYHTVTWLNLTPKAMVIRLGKRRVPDGAVILAHYGAWAVLSGLVLWILAGGAL